MMLLRSIFWLSVAYLVLHPRADLQAAADSVATKTVAAGQQFALQQISNATCEDIRCEAGKVIVSAVLSHPPSSEATMQASNSTVPLPRPRPLWRN